MLKNISNLGKELSKKEQMTINGGTGLLIGCFQRITSCSPTQRGWAVSHRKNDIGCCDL
ncbi:MAG: hypothetical protein AB8B65_12105 [Kordia sp.]|uniref:hypothetical protein n=1 Tax=Kordia sp. TaxID=1965332 RepID=UPI003858F38F